jgi:hypothetical protein
VTHAELAPVGRGVDAVIAKPDRGAVGNAAVVDLGEETLGPERFREWGQPEMWARNIAALRER